MRIEDIIGPGYMLLPAELDEIHAVDWSNTEVFDPSKAEQVHIFIKTKLADTNKLAFLYGSRRPRRWTALSRC